MISVASVCRAKAINVGISHRDQRNWPATAIEAKGTRNNQIRSTSALVKPEAAATRIVSSRPKAFTSPYERARPSR